MGARSSRIYDHALEALEKRRDDLSRNCTMDVGEGYLCSICNKTPIPHYRCHLGCDFDLCGRCRSKPENNTHQHQLVQETMTPLQKKMLITNNATSTTALLLNAFALFAKRPCFATISSDHHSLSWQTFEEIYLRVCNLGRALRSKLGRMEFVAIGGDGPSWLVCDYACQLFGLVSVPLHTHLPADRLAFILEKCKPSIVLCTRAIADRLTGFPTSCIFLIDAPETDPRSLAALERSGRDLPLVVDERKGEELLTVVWTSGSTGDSKGVMISEQLYFSEISSPWLVLNDIRRIFFAPLAHTTDRKNATISLVNGGQSLLYSGPLERLFDAAALVRPTAFAAPPRLWNELYNQYQQACLALRQKHGREETEAERDQVYADMRRLLGGMVRFATTGGAPISPVVRAWIEKCFRVELSVAYGSTESGGIASHDRARPGIEFKLIPLPELGYTPHDVPHARGEVAVRKPGIMGYWADPARNAAAFTSDGFYRTGDIGELCMDGTLNVIGRVGGAVKLAQSEWVNAEGLETELSICAWVQQIYVHAESIRSYVVVVVVPADAALTKYAMENDLPTTMKREELCAQDGVRAAILTALSAHATGAGFRSWEVPRAAFVEPEPFTIANGALTPSLKLARPVLARRYKEALDELYTSFDAVSNQSASSVVDLITQVLAKGGPIVLTSNTRLADMGVDSLTALRLRMLLKAATGADVGIDALLGQPVSEISKFLASRSLAPEMKMAGESIAVNWAQEITLPSFELSPLSLSSDDAPVLLTGCTGFVGAYILSALLQRSSSLTAYCLVRGANSSDAEKRLVDVMNRFGILPSESQWKRVIVLKGDVGEERLGLDEELYARLAASIGFIIHAAATVSAVLPYSYQRRANVVGTIHVLRFATSKRLKGVHHVSTMSVFSSSEKAVGDVDERTEPHMKNVEGRPAYGQSKWVAEKLVRAAASVGVPCAVYRLASVGGASKRPFATNTSDFTFRLLVGCCQLGLAPEMPNSTFDVTPVDWVASSLVAIALYARAPSGKQVTYHLTNPSGALSFASLASVCQSEWPLKFVPFDEWCSALERASASNVLVPLRQCFPAPLGSAGNYRCVLTLQHLKEIDESLVSCPRLRIRRHLKWATKNGFIIVQES